MFGWMEENPLIVLSLLQEKELLRVTLPLLNSGPALVLLTFPEWGKNTHTLVDTFNV